MESILDELYYAVLAKGGKPFACQDEEVNKEEVQAEEELKKVLSPEQWSGFVTFLDRYAERRDAEMKNAYRCGVRQGLVLAVESFCEINR
ncbi:MAG: hypothetical protein IJY63_02795 [Clostridia bacterium]|nr:hypothetical protein [Clostridia bacterium]